MVNVAAVSAIVATSAAIAKVVVLVLFISQKISSSILYFRCFTSSANNTVDFVDIFKHYYFRYGEYRLTRREAVFYG